jgi:hypothetical protein
LRKIIATDFLLAFPKLKLARRVLKKEGEKKKKEEEARGQGVGY